MASKCNKFLPNIFNKTKCQHCFAAKEAHSAEALENNKASRKVSKCGYLFVSPGFDFNNPLDRSRRWQRRFFVLYDDGELSYSVDENPDTVPQGVVDMNKCTDVNDAEAATTHANSLSIITPDKTVHIKANSKEEIQWWHDILAEFPKALKAVKPRRKQPLLILSNKENLQPGCDVGGDSRSEVKSRVDAPAFTTFRGVRSLKHKYDANYQDGMRKSSSLHDLSSEQEQQDMRDRLRCSRFLSHSGDRLDVLSRDATSTFSLSSNKNSHPADAHLPNAPYFTMPRSTWTRTGQPVPPAFLTPAKGLKSQQATSGSHSSISSTTSSLGGGGVPPRRGSFDERPASSQAPAGRLQRERSSSLKDFPTQLSLARDGGEDLPHHSMSADETDSNETDELKMARNSEFNATSRALGRAQAAGAGPAGSKYEDLVYMKKGWLIKQTPSEKESKKHWFVLAGNSLRYYQDAKAEEGNALDGRIDLSTCYEVSELTTHRNYGFKIKTRNGEYVLAAMTSGIRNNWMKAIRLCMELHSSLPKRPSPGPSPGLPGVPLSARSPARDDLEFKSGAATSSTTAVTGAGGETAFQLVGRRESYRRESQKPARRHHSDVNPGNVSKVLSVKEFSASIDVGGGVDPLASSGSSTRSSDSRQSSVVSDANNARVAAELATPRASKIPRHRSPSSESAAWSRAGSTSSVGGSSGALMMKRYVEGSDSLSGASLGGGGGGSGAASSQGGAELAGGNNKSTVMSKRNVTSESTKEEVKREMMRRAKSPSARVKEKSRAAKTPRLHSPIYVDEMGYGYHHHAMAGSSATASSDAGSAMSDTLEEAHYSDIAMSEEEYPGPEDTDPDEVGSATASDVVGGDEALVEILETEVESLKDRLEHTQTELDKVHKDNIDLKSRLHKEATQSVDSGYSTGSRWAQNSSQNEQQGLKRQLKESRDVVQRQRLDIESLKSKLDMSVSKLTGTEKALSEALRDYKQEKDKFLKMSSEWNRRIRTMESQSKDSLHKLERNRETLQAKERECRRLEAEVKNNLQRMREQEREILKLKAVEHEYNLLKEKLDDREQELSGLRSELKEKDHLTKKTKDEYERHLEEIDREYSRERDDLELHLEQLKSELYSAHDRQASMTDNMTSDMTEMIKEKDDIIAQLEEKMIETDKRLIEMSEELHAEMGENAEMAHSMEMLQGDKKKLIGTMEKLEAQLMAVRTKVSGFESENASLKKQLEELRRENSQLQRSLSSVQSSSRDGAASEQERERLQKTIADLNSEITSLQAQLDQAEVVAERSTGVERGSSSISSISSVSSDHHQDLLHTVLLADSRLKEVNAMLLKLRHNFDSYLDSLTDEGQRQAIVLADFIEDVGHKCQDIQDTLRDSQDGQPSSPPSQDGDYKHVVTVTALSGGKAIMEEYKGLKVKFDQAVVELRKVKKDFSDRSASYESLRQEDRKLKEKVAVMEGTYNRELVQLIARVDGLSHKIVNVQTQSTAPSSSSLRDTSATVIKDIEQQLQDLDSTISSLEQQAASLSPTVASSSSSSSLSGQQDLSIKLEAVRSQLEDTNTKLKSLGSSLSSSSSGLVSKVEAYKGRLGSLSQSLQSSSVSSNKATAVSVPNSGRASSASESGAASAGVSSCLLQIKEKIQEIGEQLDSLEEDGEDSDSDEEDSEQTTVEDIREKLASLTEFVEQHSKMSSSDWELLRLLTLHKEVIQNSREPMETDSVSDEHKLKLYADRLSLEAVILSEMAHILQSKDHLVPEDSVSRQIDALSSQLLSLHHTLDTEMKTMHFEDPQADLLASYAELVAEKILVNSQLCSSTFDQRTHMAVSGEAPSSTVQPVLLATEAILRSQVDSCINGNFDRSADELLVLPTHLTSRTLIQGELTYALASLKDRLAAQPEVLQPGLASYQFMLNRVLERQQKVMASIECYERQLTHSLAVIIFKESEEMTIVEGPESVLEAMCSELSTIIETHIQRYKEKCRAAMDTHSARKYDIIVNELRCVREAMLAQIKSQHEAYARDPSSVRDSSLDIPVQSLDSTISKFGEILSLKAVANASSNFLSELLKMGSSVLEDLELEPDSSSDDSLCVEKGLNSFVLALSQALQSEALSKETLSRRLTVPSSQTSDGDETEGEREGFVLRVPDLSHYPDQLGARAGSLVRESVFSAQLTLSLFKQKLLHAREMSQLKARRPVRVRPELNPEESHDSDDTLDLQTDFQALLSPLEEVLESKHEDELEVLQVLVGLTSQLKVNVSESKVALEEQVCQLEQKLQHELEVARQRHDTHLEVFKQESHKLEKTLEEQQQDREHYEERSVQLEEELTSMQLQHEEEKERVKQDILTAVHAIRNNDEKSETHLIEKVSKLSKEIALQKLSFRKTLGALKKEVNSKEKSSLIQSIEEHISSISLSAEDEEEEYQPPLPTQPPPEVPHGAVSTLEEHSVEVQEPSKLDLSHHEQEVEQLRKEKEEALAEEMRNTKAALDAMRKAYEEELGQEKAKYKEALVTMYTEEYVTEIRLRHQEDEEKMSEELQKLNMHYSSKCEDYKLLEMKLQQTKQDFESHINQLISSNDHLEEMLNREIDSLKDFIKNKPSTTSMTTGSATIEEELYDAKIMVRVKDAELQKLRSQVKNLENSLHRTTEEQRQTMTQYMQSLKTSGEMKKQFQEEINQLTEKLNKVLGSQGLKANIRRTPSFHQRARSPSPTNSPSPRKESDHSSRDSHRRRHIHPKDLRRSKSSPSLPYVFDGKASPAKSAAAKLARRSRSPKT
ncbi:golgin subfamily A member 4 isoform X2 [Aplysia californica]|uniref:Golgin subfamily A member 4 isoform X2 n=1 Tax=Aplysia californica TaxID=6500 RepID=A0ABM0JF83_APLCA|nr:golgin subfamily A member 4 isoform X2 [Aplysia californica]